MVMIMRVRRIWNSRRHGSCSGVFQEPSPIQRRLVICHQPPSEIIAVFGLDQNFPFWHPGWRISYTGPPPLSTGVSKLVVPKFLHSQHLVALQWGEILRLVVGIRAPKGTPHDFSHPSDAYAYVVVKRGDDMVGGNCARAGLAWRSTRQSLAKRRIRSGDAPRAFTA